MSSERSAAPARLTVAITGYGVVSALGWGVRPFADGLTASRAAIGPFDRFDPSRQRTRIAAQVPAPAPRLPLSASAARRLSWADRFALAAAAEAARHADLDVQREPHAVGVYFGSSTGGMLEAESLYDQMCDDPRHARVSTIASQSPAGPAEAVARHLGLMGPVETISSACASAAMAIGSALAALREGSVDVAIAGGADSLCRVTYAGFNALRAVDPEPCRPFRASRAGLSLGEGAGVLVLERAAHAAARGARPHALLLGAGNSCDAYHMTTPEPEGEGAARALVAALADAGIGAAAVDFVNAHGTATPHNDEAEARALRRVFGARAARLPVTSTKAIVGHLLGSAGAVESVATLLALASGWLHAMPGPEPADPALGLDPVIGEPRRLADARVAVSANFGFGGANAALVFARPEETR
jgi:3-oxoacyl-[acyl-carrier-protein] synthase II